MIVVFENNFRVFDIDGQTVAFEEIYVMVLLTLESPPPNSKLVSPNSDACSNRHAATLGLISATFVKVYCNLLESFFFKFSSNSFKQNSQISKPPLCLSYTYIHLLQLSQTTLVSVLLLIYRLLIYFYHITSFSLSIVFLFLSIIKRKFFSLFFLGFYNLNGRIKIFYKILFFRS